MRRELKRELREAAVICEIAAWIEAESTRRGSLISFRTELFCLAVVCGREWK